MEYQHKLNLGKAELFGHMKMLTRFHTIWINQNGTCFTSISTDQKLAKLLDENWLDEICPNWVEIGYMNKRRPRKIYSHNGVLPLGHRVGFPLKRKG